MASKFNKFFDKFKDTKTRALLLFVILLVILIVVALYFILKEPEPVVSKGSEATKLPNINAVPGGTTTERYQELLVEENKKRAEAAKKSRDFCGSNYHRCKT